MKYLKLDKLTQDFMKTSFGNILEWYDFTIYGLFALQISKSFFPNSVPFIGLLMVFVTFAVGFLARPLGSFIFGVIGDRRGKHYAVNLSIWLMAIPTTLIGLLPGYNVIGVFAPILLVVLRICQGISAGGQFSGLIAIAVDSNAPNKSFLVSLIYTVSIIGCFIASFVGFLSISIVEGLHSHNLILNSLAWRIPFILSSVFFIIYTKMLPDFTKHNLEASHKFTIPDIFAKQPRELIFMSLLSVATGTIYYILFTYLVTYMQIYLAINKQISFLIMNGILIFSIFLYPSFGYFAKNHQCRIRSARMYALYMLGSTALFSLVHVNLWFGIFGVLGLIISFCAITALSTSLYAEVFDERYRMTACSLSFNFGITLAGFAPLISEVFSNLSIWGLPLFMSIIILFMYWILRKITQTTGYKMVINKDFEVKL